MSEDKNSSKKKAIIGLVLTAGIAPFVGLLIRLFKNDWNLDAPATMGDLLAVFGIQLAIAIAIVIYLSFFNHPVLGLS